eukprot:scaffold3221_cov118-Isochrysis_galbana.AAC.3
MSRRQTCEGRAESFAHREKASCAETREPTQEAIETKIRVSCIAAVRLTPRARAMMRKRPSELSLPYSTSSILSRCLLTRSCLGLRGTAPGDGGE